MWCDSYDENYYSIPDYSANNFIYEKNVKDAFNIINKYDRNEYEEYLESLDKDKIIEDLKAGETGTVEFTNDYDEHLDEGGISVVNTFEKVETTTDGLETVNYKYTGNNIEGGN